MTNEVPQTSQEPDMSHAIGVKEVLFRPMTKGEFARYMDRPYELSSQNDEGYLVEYLKGGDSNHPYHKGYISWSPKDVFIGSYRPTLAMTFGLAHEAMKLGYRVTRKVWKGVTFFIAKEVGVFREFVAIDTTGVYDPNKLGCVVPWTPGQIDLAAEDWVLVP